MIGQTISHYRILEELGGGGMGVVYKALDVRLNRFVALKFLSPELTRDRDANQRFRQEAQAASALDHPNICTIHEIDETPSGELFLTMAYYEGETLKTRIARGQLAVTDALDLAIQAAQGLSRAHQSGILHRDIKPANLMVSTEGAVKIVDFGLAKLGGKSDVTRTGMILGTVAYMSPEQARGDALDARTDVWSLGVVLYEMLTSRRPFAGKDDVALLSSILSGTLEPVGKVRPELPARVQDIVAKAVNRDLASRYPSATELLADLNACRDALAGISPRRAGVAGLLRKPVVAAAIAAVLVAIAVPVALALRRSANERWARDVAIPEVARLAETDNPLAAFALARQAEAYVPNDPRLAGLWNQISVVGSILTVPEGAEVSIQPYGATDDRWELLGPTPLKAVRVARGVFRVRFEKSGFESRLLAARNPGPVFNLAPTRVLLTPFAIPLAPQGSSAGMELVPGGAFPVGLTGFNSDARVSVAPFRIDRHEVTNREFKAFVEGGGYKDPKHWADLPLLQDGRQSWESAVRTFVDSTNRGGPATWELGDFPSGQGDFPVSGVSWYEAAAYCRSAGKALPTLFHWAQAAVSQIEIGSPLAPAIIPLSNFARKGLAPVGSFLGVGPYGTFDTAGNAREWVWNEGPGSRRWILGGAWNDPDYMATVPTSLPPLDRSATNGFRCARYEDHAVDATLLARVEPYSRDHRTAKAVSDEVYQVFTRQYALVKSPLNERVEATNTDNRDWVRETLSFDAGYGSERVIAHLFLPRTVEPPYQLVVFFPGVGQFIGAGSSKNFQPADFIVRAGRALLVPIYKGSFERWDPFVALEGPEYLSTFRARMGHWRQDLGRTLDVLAKRADIDMSRIAYFGASFGASTAFPLIALEDRVKVAVLAPAGFTYREMPPEADAINYVSRVKIPVLLMGGRHDYIFPPETSQKPMFDRLGTPAEHKRHVILDSGHGLPRTELIREVLAWLDKYLGPVGAKRAP